MIVPEQMGLGELGNNQPWYKNAVDQAEKFVGDSGEAAAVEAFGNKPLPPDSELVQYVSAVGADLVPQIRSSRRDFGYKFGVLDTPIVNAFALPNGSIYVTTGLLQRLRTEDELAALLGHEITHVTEHDGLQSIGLGVASLPLLQLAARVYKGSLKEEDRDVGIAVVHSLINNGYSREQEGESDRIGHHLSYRSGYNPYGMVGLMEQFLALEETEPGSMEKMFMSHPWSGDRVLDAKGRLTDMQFDKVNARKARKGISFNSVRQKAAAYDKDKDLALPIALFGTSVGLLALVMYLR